MKRTLANALSALLLTCIAFALQAEEVERPAWLSDEVVAAAMAIGMSEEQLGPFRENVRIFLEDLRSDMQRVIRRGGADLENTVRRTQSKLVRELDERMAKVLDEEQMPRYETYRDLLVDAVMPDQ